MSITQQTSGIISARQEKGRKIAKGVIVALGLVLGIAAVATALPFLIALAQNLLYLGILGGVLALGTFFFTRKSVRTAIKAKLNVWANSLSNLVVKTNYLEILDDYVKNLQLKLQKIRTGKLSIAQQKGKMQRNIESLQEKQKEFVLKAKAAQQQLASMKENGDDDDEILKVKTSFGGFTTKIGQLASTIERREKVLKKMTLMYEVLSRMEYYAGVMAERISFSVETQKEEHQMIIQSHKAMATVHDMAFGGTEEKRLFDESMAHMVNMTGEKVGSMEMMMDELNEVISEIDYDRAMDEQRGLQILENWEKKWGSAIDEDIALLEQGESGFEEMLNKFTKKQKSTEKVTVEAVEQKAEKTA